MVAGNPRNWWYPSRWERCPATQGAALHLSRPSVYHGGGERVHGLFSIRYGDETGRDLESVSGRGPREVGRPGGGERHLGTFADPGKTISLFLLADVDVERGAKADPKLIGLSSAWRYQTTVGEVHEARELST